MSLGKVIIGLVIIIVIVLAIGFFPDNIISLIGFILLIMGGLAFCISHYMLARAALNLDLSKWLLFVFVPFYDMIFAVGEYDSENKSAVLVAWFGGSFLALIGALILFWEWVGSYLDLLF